MPDFYPIKNLGAIISTKFISTKKAELEVYLFFEKWPMQKDVQLSDSSQQLENSQIWWVAEFLIFHFIGLTVKNNTSN